MSHLRLRLSHNAARRHQAKRLFCRTLGFQTTAWGQARGVAVVGARGVQGGPRGAQGTITTSLLWPQEETGPNHVRVGTACLPVLTGFPPHHCGTCSLNPHPLHPRSRPQAPPALGQGVWSSGVLTEGSLTEGPAWPVGIWLLPDPHTRLLEPGTWSTSASPATFLSPVSCPRGLPHAPPHCSPALARVPAQHPGAGLVT